MPDKLITTMDLMRHGEPVGGRKYRGQQDDPLTPKGWEQMRQAIGDQCPWQAVVSSPLSRCSEFSREVARRHGLPLEFDSRLAELGFGDWEGHTPQELTAEDPELLFRFRRDPLSNAPPGAEPLAGFQERVLGAWNFLRERYSGQHVLLVAHAGVIRMILAHVLEIPLKNLFRIQVPNAGISRVRIEASGTSHLPQLLFHGRSL